VLTSSTVALGHSYWERPLRDASPANAYAREARDVIMKDHGASDAHLDEIIRPTLSVAEPSPAVPRHGASHREPELAVVFQVIAGRALGSGDSDIRKAHGGGVRDVMETLGADASDAAGTGVSNPAGKKRCGMAKRMRRQALREGGRHEPERVEGNGRKQHFGLPTTGARLLETVTGAAALAGE